MSVLETIKQKEGLHFNQVNRLIRTQGLPKYMLGTLKYATYNTSMPSDFDQVLAYLKADRAKQIFFTESQEGGRFMMTAQLIWDLYIKDLGHIEWVNVVEPPEGDRPFQGVDYTGYQVVDLSQTEELLAAQEFDFDSGYDWGHPYLSLPLNAIGNEVRVSDVYFGDAVQQQYEEGNFQLIYQRKV